MFKQIATLGRLFRIYQVLIHHGLDELLPSVSVFRFFRILLRCSPLARREKLHYSRGVRIRQALEELGPLFVKFGQTLSTRRDLLPDDIAIELVKLQDRVPPFAGREAIRIIETALQAPLERFFTRFDEQPLASASIAQVHSAVLPAGDSVVIKVLRPGIEKAIERDIALLYAVAGVVDRFWVEAKRLHPVQVVAEFEKTLLGELDLVREAANAAELRRHFEHSEILYIPKICWELTRRQILVMEKIEGIPVGDVARLVEAKTDLKLLAERGVEIFFTQVFRDNFFHADMHPGNIFVAPGAKYIAVDFGIVGSLSYEDQRYLAENFLAFFHRDYRRVALLHVQSGWVPNDTRIDEFESEIRAVCEPIFEKPLGEISYGHLLLRLFQTARRFNMEVQPQLVLLQKTLLNIEGLGRDLYPELDLWQTAKPFLEKWYRDQMGPIAGYDKLREELPEWLRRAPEIPGLSYQVLKSTAEGQLTLNLRSDELQEIRQQLEFSHKRLFRLAAGGITAILALLLQMKGMENTALIVTGLASWLLLVAFLSRR